MSFATTSALLLRRTISRLPLRLRNGRAVTTAARLSPTLLRAGNELGRQLPHVRSYASHQPPGGMGGGPGRGGIPNFLFQQPRQKGETLKEYVSLQDTKHVSPLFTSFVECRSDRNGA